MKLQIKTLSPIHIGNGESFKPLSYVMDMKFVYILNMEAFFKELERIGKQKDYLSWLEPILYKLSDINDKISKARNNPELKRDLNRQRIDLESQLSLEQFIKKKIGNDPVEFVENCVLYKVPFSLSPQRDGFKTCIKDGNGRVYIPGTEIKGAIRTSLLYRMLQDNSNYGILKSEVEKFRTIFKSGVTPKEKIRALKNISRELEGKLLRGNENKAHFDFLKLILVSDTIYITPDKLRLETTKMIGTERYTKTWVETIIPNIELEFELSINKKTDLRRLGIEKLKDWLHEEKLLETCYYRSQEILEIESQYFLKSSILPMINRLKEQNKKDSPLIRMGAGQGFLGITIDLIMKKKEDQAYEVIREGVSFQRRWRTQRGNFPKTRRVVIDKNGKENALMGWAKIIKKNG